jgi:rhodanese-related sulfurtransferase
MTTTTITPNEAAKLIANGQAMLVDVREPGEFSSAHIASAVSIPLSHLSEFLASEGTPDKPLIMQCQRGARGENACALANSVSRNLTVYNMEGGIEAWQAAGLPVIGGGRAPKISIFRQVQIIVGGLVALGVVSGFLGYPVGFAAAGFFGAMLAIAGVSGWCGLALLLNRMPWNRPALRT